MSRKEIKVGVIKKPGYTYFIDKDGDISSRSPINRLEKVAKMGLKRKEGRTYYVGEDGDVYSKSKDEPTKPKTSKLVAKPTTATDVIIFFILFVVFLVSTVVLLKSNYYWACLSAVSSFVFLIKGRDKLKEFITDASDRLLKYTWRVAGGLFIVGSLFLIFQKTLLSIIIIIGATVLVQYKTKKEEKESEIKRVELLRTEVVDERENQIQEEMYKLKAQREKLRIREEAEKRVYGEVKTKREALSDDFKEAIFDKFNNECAVCGKTDGLEIHHKDGNPKNNEISNLTVLCGVCHKKTRMKVR
jgi:5-methylcytosine-specific restriction endonuclease McrA